MALTCVYGGSCSGCMTCQDGRFYYPEEEPEPTEEDEDDE